MYERCGMGSQANGVKRNTLRWFGHIERMGSEEFVKRVYMSESVGPNSRGRPPVRWSDRVRSTCVKEVLPEEEGWIKQLRRKCLDRER